MGKGKGRLMPCGLIYVTFSDGLIIFAFFHREAIAFICGQMVRRCDLNEASNRNHRQIILTQPEENKGGYASDQKKEGVQNNAETNFLSEFDSSSQFLSRIIKAQANYINCTRRVFIFIFHKTTKFIVIIIIEAWRYYLLQLFLLQQTIHPAFQP